MNYNEFYVKALDEYPYPCPPCYVPYFQDKNINKRFAEIVNWSYEKINRLMKRHNGVALICYNRQGTSYTFKNYEDAQAVCDKLNAELVMNKLKGA